MRKAIPTFLLFLSGLGLSGHAYTAGKMSPGLWEMRMQSDAMKAMPKMPPAQIEQMKKMGITMPSMQDGTMKTTVCISKEMTEQNPATITNKSHASCQPKNLIENGNEYSMELHCDGPELKGIGIVKGSYGTNKSMRSSYVFKGTSYNKPVTQQMETTGKWISPECGNVKPMGEMAKSK